jgi:hypothetical protein
VSPSWHPDPEEAYPNDLLIPIPESALNSLLSPQLNAELKNHLRQIGMMNKYTMTWDRLKECDKLQEMKWAERQRPLKLSVVDAAFFLLVAFCLGVVVGLIV